MSKYSKRISKLVKNPRNALVLGSAFGFLNELVGLFSTIFVLNEDPNRLRHKTIVYRDSIDLIQDIDIILVDLDYFDQIKNLHAIWRKTNPVILLQGSSFSNKKIQKLLNSENYFGIDQTTHYIIWKSK
jgi:hypothetical protein